MNYRISRQADRDLDEIWLHIARDSEDAANRVDEELHAAMRMLLRMPGMGHHRSEIQDPRYRFWSVHAYLIAYRVERGRVVVVPVVHGTRDLKKLFRKKQ